MKRSSLLKVVVAIVVVVVAVGGAGFWWYFIRDDAPDEASLVERESTTTDGTDDGAPGATNADGSWSVEVGEETFAGLRIDERFGPVDHTAVMRSPEVEGRLVVAGAEITEAEMTVDVSALESVDDQPPGAPAVGNRVGAMRDSGLETERFPTATFALTTPIELGEPPTVDEPVSATAEGDLTIHGETQAVSIPVEARWNGELIDVAGSLEVALADYGMEPPSRQFVTVEDTGTMEFQLTFAR